ncbi:MAG: nucleotide exchange factor GrpE [Christensenellales bacterium]|nr:nucleotide exchange factor GrpE [Christensenellales bacterium]
MKKEKTKKVTEAEEKAPQMEEEVEKEQQPADEPAEAEATVEQWREALELAVKQRDEYLDSYRRAQADFQNFKRRNQTARSDGYKDGLCDAIEAMLPVMDNLERALDAAEEGDALAEGVRMTLKLLFDSLTPFGFEEVPALGEEFDPELHNAVMREQTDDPGKVIEVFQKGYRVKDKIIRYAMVKVSVE